MTVLSANWPLLAFDLDQSLEGDRMRRPPELIWCAVCKAQAAKAMRWLGKNRSGDEESKVTQSADKEAAFRRDLEREIPWLLRLANALTGDKVDAQDVAQETLKRALEHHRERRAGASLHAWLRSIARNFWLNELDRRKVRGLDDSVDPETLTDDNQVAYMEAKAELSDIEEGCVELPKDYVDIIVLIDVEGLTRREAAEQLGVPIGTIHSRITRAREAAREAKKRVLARRRRERGE